MIRALIFDFDGTILDTETPSFLAWQKTYADHGHTISLEEYSLVVGTDHSLFDPRKTLEERVGKKLDWTRMDAERRAHDLEMISRNEVLPGVRELLCEALQRNIPCAVASSSPIDWVESHLDRLKMREFFAYLCCAGNRIAPKPSPGVYLEALELLGVAAGETIAIEDSLNGLRAARAAGIPCVVVPNSITRHLCFPPEQKLLPTLKDISLSTLKEHAQWRIQDAATS